MTFLTLQAIGQRVREARKAAGLRQVDLAERAGVSRYTVVKLETGQLADVNYKTLVSILSPLRLQLTVTDVRPSGLPILGEPDSPGGVP